MRTLLNPPRLLGSLVALLAMTSSWVQGGLRWQQGSEPEKAQVGSPRISDVHRYRTPSGVPAGPWIANCETPFTSQINDRVMRLMEARLSWSAEELGTLVELRSRHAESVDSLAARGHPIRVELDLAAADAAKLPYEQRIPILAQREKQLGAFADELRQLDDTFLDSVEALLDDEKRQRWPSVRKQIDRLRFGRVAVSAGEGVIDVAELYERFRAEQQEAGEVLPSAHDEIAAYAERYDAPVRAIYERQRASARSEYQRLASRLVVQGESYTLKPDPSDPTGRAVGRAMKVLIDETPRLVAANRAAIDSICALLPERVSHAFRYRYARAAAREAGWWEPAIDPDALSKAVEGVLPSVGEHRDAFLEGRAAFESAFITSAFAASQASLKATTTRWARADDTEIADTEQKAKAAIDTLDEKVRQFAAHVQRSLTPDAWSTVESKVAGLRPKAPKAPLGE